MAARRASYESAGQDQTRRDARPDHGNGGGAVSKAGLRQDGGGRYRCGAQDVSGQCVPVFPLEERHRRSNLPAVFGRTGGPGLGGGALAWLSGRTDRAGGSKSSPIIRKIFL